MQAYCVKCRTKTEMKNGAQSTCKNGRCVYKGNCSRCNSPVSVFVKKAK